MITDSNRIRKISLVSYQILKEKSIPVVVGDTTSCNKMGANGNVMRVLSVAINNQGKVLVVVCDSQVLIMDEEL